MTSSWVYLVNTTFWNKIIKKPFLFWRFQGDQKGTLGRKEFSLIQTETISDTYMISKLDLINVILLLSYSFNEGLLHCKYCPPKTIHYEESVWPKDEFVGRNTMFNPKNRYFSIFQWFIRIRPSLGSSSAHFNISYRRTALFFFFFFFLSAKDFRVTVSNGLCERFLTF